MKKTLLIIMTVAFCASLMAQQAQRVKPESVKALPIERVIAAADTWENDKSFTPTLRNSPLLKDNELYHSIGQTHYNLASNNNARNTISFRENSNHAAAVWMMSSAESPTRGTGINYFNVATNSWNVIPDVEDKIETVRTGWGGHAFTENGEVVIAHDGATGLVINTRDTWGEGEWTQTILKAPEYTIMIKNKPVKSTALLWPTMIANGNTVHLLAVTEQWDGGVKYCEDDFPQADNGYKGYSTYPLYYRSIDGGKNWEGPRDFMVGADSLLSSYEMFKVSADDYVFAAKGDHIVLLLNCPSFVIYLESMDNGVTWKKHEVFNAGEVLLFAAETPPVLLPQNSAIAIDDNDKVHVLFGVMAQNIKADDYNLYYWPFETGMLYWNNVINDDPLNWEDYKGTSADGEHIDSVFWDGTPGYIPIPSVVGLDQYYRWVGGPEYEPGQFKNAGFSCQQRLLAKKGKVYAAYQSTLDYPINFIIGGTPYFARAIFVTVSEDNGVTWDVQKNTSWITYTPELLWVDWSNYFEEAWPWIDSIGEPHYYGGLIRPQIVTENAYPSLSFNTKKNVVDGKEEDMFLLQWYNRFDPFPADDTVFEDDPMDIVSFAKNLSELPAYKNIGEIYKNLWSDAPVITCISDDITDNSVRIVFDEPFYQKNPILTYNLYRDYDSTVIAEIPYGECFFNITDFLEVDTDYIYQVSANYLVDGDFKESSWSCAVHYKLGDNTVPCSTTRCETGVKYTPVAPNVKIYPNPANGNVWIKVDATTPYTVTITNIMGQVIKTMNGNTDKVSLNVSNYAPGVYIVNVRTAGAMTTQKLIVR